VSPNTSQQKMKVIILQLFYGLSYKIIFFVSPNTSQQKMKVIILQLFYGLSYKIMNADLKKKS